MQNHIILFLLIIFGSTLFFAGIIIDIIFIARRKEITSTWTQGLAYAKNRPWQWQDALVMILTISFAIAVSSLLPGSRDLEEMIHNGILLPIIKTSVFHVSAFIVVLIIMQYRGMKWQSAFGALASRFKYDIFMGVALYIGAIPIVTVLGILSYIILTTLHIEIVPQDVALLFLSSTIPLWFKLHLIIMAIVIAPIVEEICFRGVILPILLKNSPPVIAIVAVSLLFAGIHFSLSAFLPLTGIAIIFALGYIYTGSLLTSITMHAIFNSVSIITLLCAKQLI